jgi:DNA (cytosine-5)-methyltransferase 1
VVFQTYQKVTDPLMANSHPGSYTGQDAFSDMLIANPEPCHVVRRLTPLECCRLQGFPDWWVDGCENHPITGWWARGGYWTQIIDPRPGVAGFDSAIYKMWGNGIALPCAEFVMRRIVKYA